MVRFFKSRRVFFAAGAALIALQTFSFGAMAQSAFPSRPIRFLVGSAAGGANDNVARIVASEMSKTLGQQVVIENKTGASGNIAAQALLSAPADGHTIMLLAFSNLTNPAMMDSVGYNPNKDLGMVSQLTSLPVVALTRGDSTLNNLQDVISAAKSKNGSLRIGCGGLGTSSHLAAELMSRTMGFKYTAIPYRGGAPALQALFSGETDLMFDFITPTLKSNAEAGKIKFLGVMQKDEMIRLPGIKSASAQGLPAAAFIRPWQAVALRNGTSPAVVAKLHSSIVAALQNKEVVEKLEAIGSEIHASSAPAEMEKLYKEDLQKWTTLIKEAGIKAEQ